jgi:hypothetical protein
MFDENSFSENSFDISSWFINTIQIISDHGSGLVIRGIGFGEYVGCLVLNGFGHRTTTYDLVTHQPIKRIVKMPYYLLKFPRFRG